jgi:penicillin-binding protein 1A
VRLIDMTRAFAGVSAKGTSIEPYGILKVTTTGGRVLYRHEAVPGQVLVAQYVAAGITDLLQSAVATGTGRAAQIGRPVAGKTGTTSSNKDGWFLGFSSGITTGVWMGRDDARPVAGLQGGHAPARAFADYMRIAVARRPAEQFDTQLKLPEWQLEPDDEAMQGNPNDYYFTDDQGNLIAPSGAPPREPGDPQEGADPRLDVGGERNSDAERRAPPPAAGGDFLDEATGRGQRDPGLRAAPPPPNEVDAPPPRTRPGKSGPQESVPHFLP